MRGKEPELPTVAAEFCLRPCAQAVPEQPFRFGGWQPWETELVVGWGGSRTAVPTQSSRVVTSEPGFSLYHTPYPPRPSNVPYRCPLSIQDSTEPDRPPSPVCSVVSNEFLSRFKPLPQLRLSKAAAMDLREWTIFSLLSQPFLRRLKMVCVFGNLGNEALLVTKEDEVYALGSNASACHGVGDQEASLMPRKVDALCGKGIIQIDHGCGPHVLACTESGELYAWGHNGYCQLGNGSTNASTSQMVTIPAQVHFPEKKVIEVACGSHHSLALTAEGE
ncbi:unnamed protein product, partial [Cyprideis torosa]